MADATRDAPDEEETFLEEIDVDPDEIDATSE